MVMLVVFITLKLVFLYNDIIEIVVWFHTFFASNRNEKKEHTHTHTLATIRTVYHLKSMGEIVVQLQR